MQGDTDPIRGFYQRVLGLYRALQTNRANFARLTGWQPAKVGALVDWGERDEAGSPFPELPETITVIGIAAGTETPLDELLAGLNEAYDAQAAARRQRLTQINGSSGPKGYSEVNHTVVISPASSADALRPESEGESMPQSVTPWERLQAACKLVDQEDWNEAANMLGAWGIARSTERGRLRHRGSAENSG